MVLTVLPGAHCSAAWRSERDRDDPVVDLHRVGRLAPVLAVRLTGAGSNFHWWPGQTTFPKRIAPLLS